MTGMGNLSAQQLRSYVERVENLEEEKAEIAASIRTVLKDAKSDGFDAATIRQVVKLRRQDANTRAARQSLLDLYMGALGMLADTPLGEAAVSVTFGDGSTAELTKS